MTGLFHKLAVKRGKKELQEFIDKLKVIDSDSIGMVVAWATHYKNQLEQDGHKVSDPIVYCSINPFFSLELSTYIKELQNTGRLQDAAALMVWLHTIRGAGMGCLELRVLGREMWKELERGFPYVEERKFALEELLGEPVNIEGYQEFPKGFAPEPL